jgi:CheY-like chemotaxis protein
MAKTDGKKKILIVDDDNLQLETAKLMLQKEYEIVTANSGKAALECFQNGLIPNLILLDILMPEMDGWETLSRIRGISPLQNVPVAFVTAVNELVVEEHAFEMGAVDYIKKPYEKKDILKRVDTIISNS